MEIISISGIVCSPIERHTDNKGIPYFRFKVVCTRNLSDGTQRQTYYRCVSYISDNRALREGDPVFINGDFSETIRRDQNGQLWVNNNIWVRSLSAPGVNNLQERKTW